MKRLNYDCGCHIVYEDSPGSDQSVMHWCWHHSPEQFEKRRRKAWEKHVAFENSSNPISFIFNYLFK